MNGVGRESTTERTAMQKLRRLLPLTALGALALLVAAGCGGGGNKSSTTSTSGKSGGTVTVLESAGGVDSLDPGYWYYQTDYADLGMTTQRWLYMWKPNDTTP